MLTFSLFHTVSIDKNGNAVAGDMVMVAPELVTTLRASPEGGTYIKMVGGDSFRVAEAFSEVVTKLSAAKAR